MTRGGLFAPARLTALCLVGACLLCPATVLPAEPARTIALVDFAVRVPDSPKSASSWLGPALSELLQAKIQFFSGALVLERQRVRSLLREAQADVFAVAENPAALAAILPARVLITGSVSVDPRDPRRIRVQARAFEVETAKIVSEAAFAGTGELAGLLEIAEDLAQTLAAGLELSYTPEQLAYVEPARIDALRLFVEGEEHLAAGRHREAVETLQRALEGNEGRYYAAAHRLQGMAYQALAKVSPGEQERAVYEEYLKKFREDALLASGALYDLGLAYEANAMWQEAIGAYRDFVAAAGKGGESLRWIYESKPTLEPLPVYRQPHADPGRGYLGGVDTGGGHHWTVLDARTGEPIGTVPLPPGVGLPCMALPPRAGGEHTVLVCPPSPSRSGWVGMAGPAGDFSWVTDLGPDPFRVPNVAAHGGKVFLLVDFTRTGPTREQRLLTIDERSGVILASVRGGSFAPESLDLAGGVIRTKEGSYDLLTGSPVEPPPLRLTAWPGVGFLQDGRGTRLSRNGKEVLALDGYSIVSDPGAVKQGPLVLRKTGGRGGLLVDPERWSTTPIFEEFAEFPELLDWSRSRLLFSGRAVPGSLLQGGPDGAPLTEASVVLLVVDAGSGKVLFRYVRRDPTARATLAGDDVVLTWTGTRRTPVPGSFRFASTSEARAWRAGTSAVQSLNVTTPAEAHLRIGACLVEAGEPAEAEREVGLFEQAAAPDVRSALVRLKIAAARDDRREAARLAVKVLRAGQIADGDARLCLEAVRKLHPEVQDVLTTRCRDELQLRSVARPGLLVFSCGKRSHLLVDPAARTSRLVEIPDFPKANPSGVAYHGTGILWIADERASGGGVTLTRADLATGRVARRRFPEWVTLVPEFEVAVYHKGASPALRVLDPEELTDRALISLEEGMFKGYVLGEVYAGDGVVVLGESRYDNPYESEPESRESPLVVVDRMQGEEIARLSLRLEHESIAGIAADRSALYVAISGADFERYVWGGRANWLRIEALPLVPGGPRWSHEAEGIVGGSPLVEGERVSFPAYLGPLPPPILVEDKGENYQAQGPLALQRVRLDRASGRVAETVPLEPWPGEPVPRAPRIWLESSRDLRAVVTPGGVLDLLSPEGPRCLEPGSARSRKRYWPSCPRLRADQPVWPPPPGAEDLRELAGLLSQLEVFEPVGGAILVKDQKGAAAGRRVADLITGGRR